MEDVIPGQPTPTPQQRIIAAARIVGTDDDSRMVVGRVVPAPGIPTRRADGGAKTFDVAEKLKRNKKKEELDGRRDEIYERGKRLGVISPKNIVLQEELGEGEAGGGKRMNKGKLRMDLLPPEWLFALADVMTQGAKKYDPRNWEEGMSWSSMIGCTMRHISKFQAGERYDGEKFDVVAGTTGCHHLAMAAWNILALMTYDLRGIGDNDLPEAVQLNLFDRVNAETTDLEGTIYDT